MTTVFPSLESMTMASYFGSSSIRRRLLKIDNSTRVMDDPTRAAAVDTVREKYGVIDQPTVLFIGSHGRELPAQTRVKTVVDGKEMLRRMRAVETACTAAVACLARWLCW